MMEDNPMAPGIFEGEHNFYNKHRSFANSCSGSSIYNIRKCRCTTGGKTVIIQRLDAFECSNSLDKRWFPKGKPAMGGVYGAQIDSSANAALLVCQLCRCPGAKPGMYMQ